jgi:hypothetical protein
MSLRRTSAGLASLHLFFRVDVVVFCEGGQALDPSRVARGDGSDETLDVLFWRRISEFVGAARKYHFKSVGSKTTLLSIARDIRSAGISSILICLDRDFDWHCSRTFEHENVVYCYGYSWENDVVSDLSLERVFFRMVSRGAAAETLFQQTKRALERFSKQLVTWCEIEIALSSKSKGVVFPRDKPLAMIDMNSNPLALDKARLKNQLVQLGYKRGPAIRLRVAKDECLRHSWGKLVARFAYHVVRIAIRKRDQNIRLDYEVFMRLVMADMIELMRQGQLAEMALYYQSLVTVFK